MAANPLRFALAVARRARLRIQLLLPREHRPRLLVFPSGSVRYATSSRLRGLNVARGLPSLGWNALLCSHDATLSDRRLAIRRFKPDVILLQKARHHLNRPHLFAPTPCVFDLDDADFHDHRFADATAACCRESIAVVAGGSYVAEWCRNLNSNVRVIWTGAEPVRLVASPPSLRPPIIAWAQASPINFPDELALVKELAVSLRREGVTFTLWLFGRSPRLEPHLKALQDEGVHVEAWSPMRYPQFLRKLSNVAVGLQPVCADHEISRGKSFGKVLAYLSAKVPVVSSPSFENAAFFCHDDTALFATELPDWSKQVSRLLGDPDLRDRLSASALSAMNDHLTIEAMCRAYDRFLRDAVQASADPPAGSADYDRPR